MRIVSLVPSLTELLCELGLRDQVVGRTGFCIHPKPMVGSIPKVGGTKSVDVEKVRALAPTHLVVNVDENEKPTVDALAQFVPHLVVTHPQRVEDNLELYRSFGERFGCADRGEAMAAQLQQALAQVRQRSYPLQRVLYLIWKDPWMTISASTYIASMLAQVGLIATAPDSTDRYPQVDFGRFDLEACDWVLFSSEPYKFRASHREAFADAHRRDPRICLPIDGEMTSWYGSRAIRGLQYMMQFRERLDGVGSVDSVGSARVRTDGVP